MNTWLTDKDYAFIYSRVPRLNVEIVIHTPDGLVLAKRSIEPYLHHWHLPGGRIRMHETPQEAAVRMAKLETGLDVEVTELLGVITYKSLPDYGSHEWCIGIAYAAKIVGGTLQGSDVANDVKVLHQLPDLVLPEQRDFIVRHELI